MELYSTNNEAFSFEDRYILYRDECYQVVGACMEVHKILKNGLSEKVYQDALEKELSLRNIPFVREQKFEVEYKGSILPHYYFADFVAFENLIIELKACENLVDVHRNQLLNYISIAKSPLGLLVNFGTPSLQFKRVINSNLRNSR